jgi:hypothetical protein
MVKFLMNEYVRMNEALHQIAQDSENILQKAERSYLAVQDSLLKVREFIIPYTFKDEQEEIQFFKEMKPKFLKELIFHMEVYHLEANKTIGSWQAELNYYHQETERIRIFFDRNKPLYTYYKTGKVIFDTVYFKRQENPLSLVPEYFLDLDPRFATANSLKLSKIKAFEELKGYIDNCILQLSHKQSNEISSDLSSVSLPWTDKKTGLIELLYGIQCMGALNNARAELKQIARLFEIAFKVDLGNYYRVFQEIRIRKKGRTPFIDRMREMLIKKMDDTDEYFA